MYIKLKHKSENLARNGDQKNIKRILEILEIISQIFLLVIVTFSFCVQRNTVDCALIINTYVALS